MPDSNAAFVGSIPETYDRHLGPVLFEPYAADMVERVPLAEGMRVLEIACGTGILTRRLATRLPANARLMASDLNEGMLDVARRKFGESEIVEFLQADATVLPFLNASFEVVVCQFGLMFFPDKVAAVREVHRVLVPGGTFLFSVWDDIKHNELPDTRHQVLRRFFEEDPSVVHPVAFSFHDPDAIRSVFREGGFQELDLSVVQKTAVSQSAAAAAAGLVEGTPMLLAIRERQPSAVPAILQAVTDAIAERCGDHPARAKMQAIVGIARR